MDDTVTPEAGDKSPANSPQRGKVRAGDVTRLCIVTRGELPVEQMIRFVAGPDGALVPDLAQRLPGRGVWVDGHRDHVLTAVKKGLFQRSLKQNVKVGSEIADLIERLLAADVRQALSLTNKAGLLVTGFGKVDAELGAGRVALLIQAQEARPDGAGKLARKFQAVARDRGAQAPLVDDLSSADLGLAIGGENVIHAALAAGGQTRNFLRRVLRLRRYRTASTEAAAAKSEVISEGGDMPSSGQIGTDQE